MDNINLFTSINGKHFLFQAEDRSLISVICAGYIITPEGKFVKVLDNESHSGVFSNYLYNYLNNNVFITHEVSEATEILTKHNHIVYFGIKLDDMANVYSNLGNNNGLGVFVFPDDMMLTDEQKEACLDLIATNRSIFGNHKKIELSYNTINNDVELDEALILQLLNNNNKKKNKI